MEYTIDTEARTIIIDESIYHIESEVFDLIISLKEELASLKNSAAHPVLLQLPVIFKDEFERILTEKKYIFKQASEKDLHGTFWDPEKIVYYLVSGSNIQDLNQLVKDFKHFINKKP